MSNTTTNNLTAEVLVLGAGPGGYAAAFRAADLGKKVVLVEKNSVLGGTCLNVGCIPSKALLHAANVLQEAKEAKSYGVEFGALQIDINKLRAWKDGVVRKLNLGLASLAKQRQVTVLSGFGKFVSANQLEVTAADGAVTAITFQNAIIAVGSEPVKLNFLPQDPRIIDSTSALALADIPKKLLVVGAGVIGLEMATFYQALGSEITVVELLEQILPGMDSDVVRPLEQRLKKMGHKIFLKTKLEKAEALPEGIKVIFTNETGTTEQLFDRVLVAVGRRPLGVTIAAEKIGINVDARGFIAVNNKMQTNLAHIYAIGDVIGNPMLAHKASYEGRLAAEIIAGSKRVFAAKSIASVAYTDPEVASVGLTESELQKQGVKFGKGIFPWIASGRALTLGRTEGFVKLLFDEQNAKLLGAAIVGVHAGDLISELALAIEMGASAHAIAATIHPHPTLAETVSFAAEVFEGTVTDLFLPVAKK